MKIFTFFILVFVCSLAGQSALAAPAPKKDSAAEKRAANSSAAEPEIPTSIFVAPVVDPKQGKDPFFPTSMRPYVRTTVHMTNAPSSLPAKLILTGLSKKLAMVNGRTFAEGEEGDVNTDNGRKHIRCIKIKEDSDD